jgi:tetratricopeptide (TPR) repeat protein
MTRRLAFSAWLALPVLLLVAGCAETAADRLSEAMKLAEGGQFNEALAVLDEVQRKWPTRPEASSAKNSVEGVLERAALSYYDAGKYSDAAAALEKLSGPVRARLFEKKPGMRWVPKVWNGKEVTEATYLEVLAAAEAPEALKNHAAAELCRRTAVHAPACLGEGIDTAKLDLPGAIAALEKVEKSCQILANLRGRCQGEEGTNLAKALDAKFGETLKARVAELQGKVGGTRLAGDH